MPGVDGPATESLIACQPIAALTTSDSKNSPRYCVHEVAKRKRASLIAARWRRAVPASFSSDGSSPGLTCPGFGGVVSISGPTTSARRASASSNCGSARASAAEKRRISSCEAGMSSPSSSRSPFGNP